MGLFNKKEKEVQTVELTPEQRDYHMIMLAKVSLLNPLRWDESLTKKDLDVLNDSKYYNIKTRMYEFRKLYKNIIENKEIIGKDSNIELFYTSADSSLSELRNESYFQINTLMNYENVYDELIKPELEKFYKQLMCMKVLVNNNVEEYEYNTTRLRFNDNINKSAFLSLISKQVVEKLKENTLLLGEQKLVEHCLQHAKNHAKKLKNEEQRMEQGKIKKMNEEVNTAMFSSVRKAEEISQMIEESKKYQDSSSSISNNKTK